MTTETKHTPAPWVLGTYDHASYQITGPGGSMPFIASIPADRPEREANARLIAAAPELVEALRELLDLYDSRIHWGKAEANARALLAKVQS